MTNSQPIDPELLQRLTALRADLVHNGSLCHRNDRDRKTSWRLRVRVKDPTKTQRRQLSIPIPEKMLMDVVSLLLEWRAAHCQQQRDRWRMEREHENMVRAMVSGGRRKKRYAIKAYRTAIRQGSIATWIMSYGELFRPPVKPNGRPRKRWLDGLAEYLIPLKRAHS